MSKFKIIYLSIACCTGIFLNVKEVHASMLWKLKILNMNAKLHLSRYKTGIDREEFRSGIHGNINGILRNNASSAIRSGLGNDGDGLPRNNLASESNGIGLPTNNLASGSNGSGLLTNNLASGSNVAGLPTNNLPSGSNNIGSGKQG